MLVTYQKSEKSNHWLPRRAQKRVFFTPFLPFSAKNIFKNPAPSVFSNHKKLPWYKKSEKLIRRSSTIFRTNGQTDECKSMVPPKFFGSIQQLFQFKAFNGSWLTTTTNDDASARQSFSDFQQLCIYNDYTTIEQRLFNNYTIVLRRSSNIVRRTCDDYATILHIQRLWNNSAWKNIEI